MQNLVQIFASLICSNSELSTGLFVLTRPDPTLHVTDSTRPDPSRVPIAHPQT